MESSILELEGTWDEIQNRMPDFNGRHLRVTVRVTDDLPSEECGALDGALAHIWKAVPESSWKGIPSDFAENLDHYLYGTPKRA